MQYISTITFKAGLKGQRKVFKPETIDMLTRLSQEINCLIGFTYIRMDRAIKRAGIYKVTNPDGQIYIGQTVDFNARIKHHGHPHAAKSLNESMKKHGKDKHCFELIHELPMDVGAAVLNTYEVLYISQYKDCGFEVLNISPGANRQAESSRLKVSIATRGIKRSAETRKKMSESKIGFRKGIARSLKSIEKQKETMRMKRLNAVPIS